MPRATDRTLGPFDTGSWPIPFDGEGCSAVGGDGIVAVYHPSGPATVFGSLFDPPPEALVAPGLPLDQLTTFRMPHVIEALVDRPGLPLMQLRIQFDGMKPVCVRLTLASSDPPLTNSRIRIRIDELVREIATLVGDQDERTGEIRTAEFERELAKMAPQPEPGKRIPDEFFERVADVYRRALSKGQRPTQAVADAFHVSRSTAGRYVVTARRRGILGPATPGRAGEQSTKEQEPKARRRRRAGKEK